MRICKACGEEKRATEFYQRTTGSRQKECKKCYALHMNEHKNSQRSAVRAAHQDGACPQTLKSINTGFTEESLLLDSNDFFL